MAGLLFALPNVVSTQTLSAFPAWLRHTVSLGLDLRGGSLLQLQVDIRAVTKERLANILSETRKSLRKQQIQYSGLKLSNVDQQYCIEVTLLDPSKYDEAAALIKKVDKDLSFTKRGSSTIIATLSQQSLTMRNHEIIDQSIEVVRRRIDASGTKEPNIQRQGSDRIVVQLPGVGDPAEVRRLLGTTAKLSFHWLDETIEPIKEVKGSKVYLPAPPVGVSYLPEEREGVVSYLPVKNEVIIHGDALIDAQPTFDQHGRPVVSIRFNNIGRQQMDEASRNVKKQFAIVLDSKVISAPVFHEPIPNGNAQIGGRFTVPEANELALLLRAGALPAPLNIVEECVVGPSLGADSIEYGKRATVFAFGMIAAFMLLVYSYMGLFADFALVMNIVLLFAGLSLLGATLTLPGIAGIALTIGMAVDANVLIFERIREEFRAGMRVMSAIDHGYKRALTAILDSNLTTLIGAWILYYFGTGAVKGFAVTLALGVIISMFTALTLTQLFLVTWVRANKSKTLPL
ncbi:MAG: protein translocase subunit SecD [Holosporales bacterium]|nr:protein translocase subunit SecD [Holosporales bacterium]